MVNNRSLTHKHFFSLNILLIPFRKYRFFQNFNGKCLKSFVSVFFVVGLLFVLSNSTSSARQVAVNTLPELICPEPEGSNESWISGSKSNLPVQTNKKRLPSIIVNVPDFSIKFRDANPLFFPGNENAWTDSNGIYPTLNGPNSIDQLNFRELLELSAERIGVAADGVSQLVVVLRSGVPGKFSIDLLSEAEGEGEDFIRPGPGEIQLLRDGETCDTGKGHVVFAVYTAPAEFGKGTGMRPPKDSERVGRAEVRTVWLDIKQETSLGDTIEKSKELMVVRPPVVLVHGLFDNPVDAWLKYAEIGLPLPHYLENAGLVPFLVDYEATNGRGRFLEGSILGRKSSFRDNRYVIWGGTSGWLGGNEWIKYKSEEDSEVKARVGGIRQALDHYRNKLKISTTQVDVIGHSLGGILARVYASDSVPEEIKIEAREKGKPDPEPYNEEYRRPDNFGQGDIHRLITIDTPHHGSGQSETFELLTKKKIKDESTLSLSSLARTAASQYSLWYEAVRSESMAMQDLKLRSDALRLIGKTEIPSHVIVGVTNPGGIKDKLYDKTGRYIRELGFVGRMFYSFPEILDEYFKIIAKDWEGTPWEKEITQNVKQDFKSLIESEYKYWTTEETAEKIGPIQVQISPTYVFLEALRALMFRFDKNDQTVRVDSQLGGLDPESNFVTYVANEPDADIVHNVFHSYAQRYLKTQLRIVDVLKSDKNYFAEFLPSAGQRMKGYKPQDFRVDWQITGSFAKAWSGIPFKHADAYLNVAEREKVIILTRPVNPDSTVLIIGGSATKSMNVKGKSSNWGPQKGYIPREQRYSKLWRLFSGPKRTEEIIKYNKVTEEVIDGKKDEFWITNDKGERKKIVTTRQLEHKWPRGNPERVYTVWIQAEDDNIRERKKNDAEKSIYLCKGAPVNPCDCESWYDWQTGGKSTFDINTEPSVQMKLPPDCKQLKPMEVLADNTSDKELKPFLTADIDLLATGFFCPELKDSAQISDLDACEAYLKKRISSENNDCVEPEEIVSAEYTLWTPPDPPPCFDSQTGLITEAQDKLLDKINNEVDDIADYQGGNVSHHGPETQFFESPYVDYPITSFDPMGPDGGPVIISIPKGPKGFRDLHLKRYYEKKIREGFWLYPNIYPEANWKWMLRASDDKEWLGWQYSDHKSLSLVDDVVQIEPPECVKYEIERQKEIRRGGSVRPKIECEESGSEFVDRISSDDNGNNGGDGDDPDPPGLPKQEVVEVPDWLPKEKKPEDEPAIESKAKPRAFHDPSLYDLPGGESIKAGDDELRAGNYDDAIAHYEKAKVELLESYEKERLEAPEPEVDSIKELRNTLKDNWDALNHRIMIAKGARDFEKTLKRNYDFDNPDIEKEELVEVIKEHNKNPLPVPETEEGTNPLFRSKDDQYRIKAIIDPVKVETEVAAAALAKKLGIKAPAAAMSEDGNLLVTRKLEPKKELIKLKEHQLYAFRKEYARLRAFRAWIGDYDGHMENLLKGPDDQLWAIDFDIANLEGTRIEALNADFQTDAALIEASVRFPHGNMPPAKGDAKFRERHNKLIKSSAESGKATQYVWQARMDRMIRYKDMADMVRDIKEFAASEKLEKTLIEAGYGSDIRKIGNEDDDSNKTAEKQRNTGSLKATVKIEGKKREINNIEKAVESLRKRAENLDKVLRHLFDEELIEEKSLLLDVEALSHKIERFDYLELSISEIEFVSAIGERNNMPEYIDIQKLAA